jgi:hypothetical protein
MYVKRDNYQRICQNSIHNGRKERGLTVDKYNAGESWWQSFNRRHPVIFIPLIAGPDLSRE